MASVSYRNVYKRWGDVVAVNDFNLDIADKEFMVYLMNGHSRVLTNPSTLLCLAGPWGFMNRVRLIVRTAAETEVQPAYNGAQNDSGDRGAR